MLDMGVAKGDLRVAKGISPKGGMDGQGRAGRAERRAVAVGNAPGEE